jgi:hypothetical protein
MAPHGAVKNVKATFCVSFHLNFFNHPVLYPLIAKNDKLG